MAKVDKDHMTELRSASDSKATATDAVKDTQLEAVAYLINSAANTGEMSAMFQGDLLDEVKSELETEGYTLTCADVANTNRLTKISWK